jgi:lipopolysaccharide export system permease protein
MFRLLGVKEAQAAEVRMQDTVKKDTVKRDTTRKDTTTKAAPLPASQPPAPAFQPPGAQQTTTLGGGVPAASDTSKSQERIAAEAAAGLMRARAAASVAPTPSTTLFNSREVESRLRLDMAERTRNRFEIEIHKKFSLAAACLIFCVLAPPIALRFPRGGVGLVIGVSLAVFALYYVGLIGGESAANHAYVPPFWAMWGTNVMLTAVGLFMLFRVGRDSGSARGGGFREWLDTRRMLRDERRARSGS